jgi:lipopolysaccharide/colanic/teichoic acid biosynthesis glycosyltransferase
MDSPLDKNDLLEELYRRYGAPSKRQKRFLFLRKKYSWVLVIGCTQLLKRVIDITLSIVLMILLFPLFLLVALFIKLQDGGPVFYVENRVGKWGAEFPLPKFRTMIVNANEMKEKLKQYNEYKGNITFKIKKDPRITPLGRILRKTSVDELPQLWCVLKGKMSLVGPRPPLPSEVANYTLEDRRRLDVVPGITCIWQVSGRADIPFDHQVHLDVKYIESQSFWLDLKLLLKTIPAVILGKGAY